MNKTSMGLDENVAGLLCYILGWITGFIFILVEQENKFVRFHAMQSIIVFAACSVAGAILGWIPFLGWVIPVISVILWIVLMVKAYRGEKLKAPWAGNLAEKWTS